MTPFVIMMAYLALLATLGCFSARFLRRTSKDYFLASRTIGPFFLVMSIFGTTMTSFALIGSTGEAYHIGIGVYGMMASWSGIIHSAVFFLIGVRLWAVGKRLGFTTQIQYFRARFESEMLGLMLFPILVSLVVVYLLMGVLGGGSVFERVTVGAFPDLFPNTDGGVPHQIASAIICLVVLTYVFAGGLRSTAWANALQTILFMICGIAMFYIVADRLGGFRAASEAVAQSNPDLLVRGDHITQLHFLTYAFIPLSVGMFPHLFQHWLTARDARTFRASLVLHPVFIMIVWIPCVLLGVWASSAMLDGRLVVPTGTNPNHVLGIMIRELTNPFLAGLLGVGILAAIMSSLDSQFLSMGAIFTHDIVLRSRRGQRLSEPARVMLGRGFVVAIVVVTYLFSLYEPRGVFRLGIWCFSGFAALFPLVFAAVYWKRATRAGAIACVLTAAVTWLYFFRESNWGGMGEQFLVMGIMPVVFMTVASALAMIVVSLLTKPPSEATLKKFYPTG